MIENQAKGWFSLWIGLLTALIPAVSKAEPKMPGLIPQVHLEADRYVGSSADWDKLRKDLEGNADNSFRRARNLEARQLDKDAPGVRRDGEFLILVAGAGRELRLLDDAPPGDDTPSYSYYDVVPALDAYVIHAQYYEGDSWLLVSRKTGAQTQTSGLPVVSPDKRRFVTGSYDLEAFYNPNELVVWKTADDGSFIMEWKTEPKEWGPTFVKWLTPTKFQVRCEKPHWHQDKPAPKPMTRTYELVDGSWKQVGDARIWRD